MSDLSDVIGGDFIPGEHEAVADFTPLNPGKYVAEIEAAEIKDTKSGKGLNLTLQVLEEPYVGRKVFDFINIVNSSQQCQEIGQRQLASIGQALGLPKLTDSSELLNKPLVIRVAIKNREDNGEPKNVVKNYYPVDSAEQPTAASPAKSASPKSAARPVAAGNKPAMPWGGKK